MKKFFIVLLLMFVAAPCFAFPPAAAPSKAKTLAQDDNSNKIATTMYVDIAKQGMLQVPAGASDCVLGYSGVAYGCYKSWRIGNLLINNSMTSEAAVTIDTTNHRFKFRSAGVNYALPAAKDIHYEIDGHGEAIAAGIKGDIYFTHPAKIKSVTLLADQQGSIVIDLWKDTYANYPATDEDSITASAPITITDAVKVQDATLTGWTKDITATQSIRINVDSCTTITKATLIITVWNVE